MPAGEGFSPQDAADGVDCTRRLVYRPRPGQAGLPPGGDIDGGEAEHQQTQQALTPAQFPGLAAVTRAGVRHDPDRLFELGMQGIRLTLASQLQRKPGALANPSQPARRLAKPGPATGPVGIRP